MSSDTYDFGQVFQAIYIAKQKPSPPPVPESMKAVLQSYPPLGQVTPIQGKDLTLTAVLEIPKSRSAEAWEVSVWHSVDGSDWQDAKLSPIEDAFAPQTLQFIPESVSRFFFTSSFSFDKSVQFTLKFRHNQDADWRWIRDEQGLDDGLVANAAAGISSDSLSDLIPDLNSKDWTILSCTWNALGQRLTDQKIYDAIDKLSQHEINVSSLIIDDNWQSIDYKGPSQFQHGWKDFEAEPEGFPKGLKATISHIRERHPHIQHIAVWHALLGYWGGISPDGQIAKTYKTVEVVREDADRRNLPLGGKMTVVAQEDVSRFYNDFYRFLVDCGIDAVKTDAQFMMDTWIGASPRRELINTYLDAWTISTLRHFSAKAISCMSQFPQALFYSQMPTNRPTILVRNSDDFFPEIPSSHPWHVWTNAHNSIFMSYLNVLPDWDMFQTVHEYSGFHAAARCISGGPIYITDVPGEHDMDLIGQMTGLTPQGKTVIFRPSVLGKTVCPYMGYDDDSLLKVGSYHGASRKGTPILAIFNISARPLTELIPFSSFPGVDPSIPYVVRAHTTGKVSEPVKIGEPGSLFTACLPVRGYEIFSAFPLAVLSGEKRGAVSVSNLGLLGKMTGAAAIFMNSLEKRENGRVVLDTRVKAFGVVGVYISSLPDMMISDDFLVTIQEKVVPVHTVTISRDDEHVLEVDIGRAWKEMGLESRFSNEVEVKIHFSI
ncbi:hypothetical protein ACJ41O_002097 [Fusarium nematophilum]